MFQTGFTPFLNAVALAYIVVEYNINTTKVFQGTCVINASKDFLFQNVGYLCAVPHFDVVQSLFDNLWITFQQVCNDRENLVAAELGKPRQTGGGARF